jgi:hypothetical protein
VLEVADIIDELKMIRHLVDKQREVLKTLILALLKLNPSADDQVKQQSSYFEVNGNIVHDRGTMIISVQNHESAIGLAESTKILAQGVAVHARDSIVFIEEVLVSFLTEIDAIRNDAEYTHKMVSDLFHRMSNIC